MIKRQGISNSVTKKDSNIETEEALKNGLYTLPTKDEVDAKKVNPGLLVYYDLERATGSEASEIIQLAYCCQWFWRNTVRRAVIWILWWTLTSETVIILGTK